MTEVEIKYDASGPGYSVFDGGERIHGPSYLFGIPEGCVEFCRSKGWRVERRRLTPAGSGVEWLVTR